MLHKFYSQKIPARYLISPDGKIVMLKKGAAYWDGRKVFSLVDKMTEWNCRSKGLSIDVTDSKSLLPLDVELKAFNGMVVSAA